MSKGLDFAWLDRIPEAVEARFGPVTRKFLAVLRWLQERDGEPR